MLGERVERLVLRINRDLDVLRDRHPLALRAVVRPITTTITITKTTRTSRARAVTTVTTRRTSRAITTIPTRRASRTITTRTCACATTETTFATTTAASATISAKATATAVTAVSTLRAVFTIAKALDDFLFLAEVTDPRGHQAQAGQIEEISLGGFGSAGFGFAHKSVLGRERAAMMSRTRRLSPTLFRWQNRSKRPFWRPSMPAQPIEFHNRLTGRLETEHIYGEGFLRFVYENPLGALPLHTLVKRRLFSAWYGRRMDAPDTRKAVEAFIRHYGIDVTELADAPESYRTFNEFFYRKLKPSARPITPGAGEIAFPADGRHLVLPDIAACEAFFVKGIRFDLAALLQDAALAERFAQGSMLISRLCPVDYHRFHFPFGGTPSAAKVVNGPFYSVSPIALRRRPSILWENQREITTLRTDTLGDVLLLEIGATCVGSIVQSFTPGRSVAKGDEKGYFRFGGSCCITIFEPGRIRFSDDLVQHSAAGREVYAKMGDVAATMIH
jgi:phosphatidylserine decarboxylase